MVGTDTRTMGGIATVVRGYMQTPLFRRFDIRYIPTHRDGAAPAKACAAVLGWSRVLFELVRGGEPLVHIHLSSRASFWRKLAVCRMARAFGRPYILHVHGSEFVQFHAECGPRSQRLIRDTLEGAAIVLALSAQWREDLARIAPLARIEVLPNAVAMPDLPPRTAADAAPTVVFLGRLGRRKGTPELLEAFARAAPASGPASAARLVCAGDGDPAPFRARAAELGIEDRVEFPGWLTPEQCSARLAGAAVFALPSHAEGLPMALLEAMSWGLAVVSCPVGGIGQLLRDHGNGLLVPAGDVERLAGALDALLRDDALRERLGRNARATVEEEYSLAATTERLAGLYAQFGLAGTSASSAPRTPS